MFKYNLITIYYIWYECVKCIDLFVESWYLIASPTKISFE